MLTSGWALIGDLSRIVPVSPQRFASAHASTADDDDALDPAELAAPGGGLAFTLLGAAGEVVEVTLVHPSQTILVLVVTVPQKGRVTVTCSATSECVQTAAALA